MSEPGKSDSVRQEPLETDTLAQDTLLANNAREMSRRTHQPPTSVSGYDIERCLGEGSYGSVWLATEKKTGKKVAIKFYSHRRGLDWSLLNREVGKLAVLYTSRNIVGLQDVGWDSDPPYFVMEYLENGSLADKLKAATFSVSETVRIAKAVCASLVHAHGSGILHCDLKPANVLLDRNNEPRLGDFGQSRLSHEQNPALGTLFYMAPEQADLAAIPDARWDVYGLGALMYQMLTGEPPHATDSNKRAVNREATLEGRLSTYQRILRDSGTPTRHKNVRGVDRALAEIIDQCLVFDPGERLPNAQVVLDQLEKREDVRAKRPFLTLGILAPIALVLAMLPIARTGIQSAVERSEATLSARAMAGDTISAKLLASILNRELEDRLTHMIEIAKDKEFRNAVAAEHHKVWDERDRIRSLLDQWKTEEDDRRERLGRTKDTSWFLIDAEAIQIYRNPLGPTLGDQFLHRDYFHGHGLEYSPDRIPDDIQPIQRPHVSRSFVSQATNRYMVALTVPVFSPGATSGQENVIGVLGRTTHLGELLQEWAENIRGRHDASSSPDRLITLADARDGKILDHLIMSPDVDGQKSAQPGRKLNELYIPEEALQELTLEAGQDPNQGWQIASYRDPAAAVEPETYGGEWLAAVSPVGDTGWITIVQERKQTALSPVKSVQVVLIRYGALGIAVSCLLIAGSWMFLSRYFLFRQHV